jgi:hypothetical protein
MPRHVVDVRLAPRDQWRRLRPRRPRSFNEFALFRPNEPVHPESSVVTHTDRLVGGLPLGQWRRIIVEDAAAQGIDVVALTSVAKGSDALPV